MQTFKQGELLFPRGPFIAKVGRSTIRAACGQSFWVCTPSYMQELNGTVEIARSNKPHGSGWLFSLADAHRFFKPLPEPEFPGCLLR
jgi:hypothetical protein